MKRNDRFPALPEWMLGTFAAIDLVLGATMRWEAARPWVEGLPPSLIHSLLSASIYAVDAVLVFIVLRLAIGRRRPVSAGYRWSRNSLWLGSLTAGLLAWIELWFAAVHHAGHHVNGGIVAAVSMTSYCAWRLPFIPAGRYWVWLRMLLVGGAAWSQWLLLSSAEEAWRLWH